MRWLRLKSWPKGEWSDTFIRVESILYINPHVKYDFERGGTTTQTEIVLVGDVRLYTNEPADSLMARMPS